MHSCPPTPEGSSAAEWGSDAVLVDRQERLGREHPPPVGPRAGTVGGRRVLRGLRPGGAGAGRLPGDHALAGAALLGEDGRTVARAVVRGIAGAPYVPGMLARREGTLLLRALESLHGTPDVLLVDATGRDHPRRAGLALHLGAVLGVPSIGVTHRPLVARGEPPPLGERGRWSPVFLDAEEVARWVCTRTGVRPVVAHAGWRTSPEVAAEVVLRFASAARTPEPLRLARCFAREARSANTASEG